MVSKKSNNGGLLVDRVERGLRDRVARMTEAGELSLPKERDLAVEYNVSLKTVRTALEDLKREGVIRSIPGKGTFLVPEADRQRITLVFCRSITHPFAAVATQTILDVLRERGVPGAVSVVEEGRADWSSLGFAPGDVGCVLALAAGLDPAWLAKLAEDGVPVVALGDFMSRLRTPPLCHQVIPDSRASCFLATRHLLRTGHRRVMLACWGGEEAWGLDLLRGYREALDEAGAPFEPACVVTPPKVRFDPSTEHVIETLGELQNSVDALLAAPDAPTAVVHNSFMQFQVREMLHSYFHDRFDLSATVAISHVELLERGYGNDDAAWAVAMHYRSLVNLALDLVRLPAAMPVRVAVDQFQLWRRGGGRWHLG